MTDQQDPGSVQTHVFCLCLQGQAGLQMKLLQLVCWTSSCQAALQHKVLMQAEPDSTQDVPGPAHM